MSQILKSNSRKKHLVTGCSGFIGEALVLKLLETGDEVIGIDLIPTDINHVNFKFFQGSILNLDLVIQCMENVNCVHHVAAAVPLIGDVKKFIEVNVYGSEILAKAAKRMNVSQFVYTSSSAIFSNVGKTNIQSKANAFEPYGRSKALGEEKILKELENSSIQTILIRPRTVVGPGRMGIFSVLFNWIENNKNVYIIGDGQNIMQLVHIDDYCHNHLASLTQPGNIVVNLGSPDQITLEQLLLNLIKYANSKSKIVKINATFSKFFLSILFYLKISPFAPWHFMSYSRSIFFDESNKFDWQLYNYNSVEVLKSAYSWHLQKDKKNIPKELSVHKRGIKKVLLTFISYLPQKK